MKVLIAYAGKKGATAELAQEMAGAIARGSSAGDSLAGTAQVSLVDLRRTPTVDPADYDRVIVGGAVYVGSVHKAVAEFCRTNLEKLRPRPVALFLTALREDDVEGAFERSFPQELRAHAMEEVWLGGRIRFAEHNVLVRSMLRKIMQRHDDMDTLRWDEARRLATAVAAAR
ncbi:MAG: flavodoxin domain-containing protein [Alkalispirochaeta sp.]